MENANLGSIIKNQRKKHHLSQKELANEICTQPMISAIENNKYNPNGIILMKLFQRLGVSLDEINLADNFAISSNQEINYQMEKLCNHHQYQKLYQLLIKESTKSLIDSDLQSQAYYYYLAIAILQTSGSFSDAIRNFKLSLASKSNSNKSKTLVSLAKASLALIASLQKQPKQVDKYLREALAEITNSKFNNDQIVVYYLAALSKYELGDYFATLNWIDDLIDFATQHNSHYMLANAYYLLSLAATKTENENLAFEATNREKVLGSLFGEAVFKKI